MGVGAGGQPDRDLMRTLRRKVGYSRKPLGHTNLTRVCNGSARPRKPPGRTRRRSPWWCIPSTRFTPFTPLFLRPPVRRDAEPCLRHPLRVVQERSGEVPPPVRRRAPPRRMNRRFGGHSRARQTPGETVRKGTPGRSCTRPWLQTVPVRTRRAREAPGGSSRG